MEWRTGNKHGSAFRESVPRDTGGSRGKGPGLGRGRGRGRGRGKGIPAPNGDLSLKLLRTTREEPALRNASNTTSLNSQPPKNSTLPKSAPQSQDSRTTNSPPRNRKASADLNSPNPVLSSPLNGKMNHAPDTPHPSTRPKNNRRRSNRHSRASLKESSSQFAVSMQHSSQTSELSSNIDSFVEHVRAVAIANSKYKDAVRTGEVNESHFDWAEDDRSTLSDLDDAWSVSDHKSKPAEQKSCSSEDVAQNVDSALAKFNLSESVPSSSRAVLEDLSVSELPVEKQSHVSNEASTLVVEESPESSDSTMSSSSEKPRDMTSVSSSESLAVSNPISENSHPISALNNSGPSTPSVLVKASHSASTQPIPDAEGSVTTHESTNLTKTHSNPITDTRKLTFDFTPDCENPPRVETPNKSRSRIQTNYFKSHSRVSSPARKIQQEPPRPRSELGSPERTQHCKQGYVSSHTRINSASQGLPLRTHPTRPVITPAALSVISRTLGVKDASASRIP